MVAQECITKYIFMLEWAEESRMDIYEFDEKGHCSIELSRTNIRTLFNVSGKKMNWTL